MIKASFDPKSHHFSNWVWIFDTIAHLSRVSVPRWAALHGPGWAPLHYAARHSFHRVAEWLITTCAQDVNLSYLSWTPLHIASGKGRLMVVQVLLSHHADASCKWVLLHLALWDWHPTVARMLLEHGADVNFKTDRDEIPLHKLPWNLHSCCSSMAQTQMPVMYMARLFYTYPLKGDWKVARELMKLDVDVNSRDNQGRTSLQVALKKGRKKVVQLQLITVQKVRHPCMLRTQRRRYESQL